jgi:hypothetical protein
VTVTSADGVSVMLQRLLTNPGTTR